MSATIIQDILNNGKAINDNLGRKIQLLNTRNTSFNQELTKRLNDIIGAIDAFKSSNLQGLTETKNKLTEVTNELQTTKQDLEQTQAELNRVKQDFANVQNELQTANARKNELEQQVRDLDQRIKQTELEYQNKINGVRQEMSDKATQEKKDMQTAFDNQIAALNNEKSQLQKDINDAKQAQNDAVNRLSTLQKEQDGLIQNLGTINQFLAQQLSLIDTINTEQPNMVDYSDLLDQIQRGLSGVITGINQAVSTNTTMGSRDSNADKGPYDVETNFNNLLNLHNESPSGQYSQYITKVNRTINNGTKITTDINKYINDAERGIPQAIQQLRNILATNKLPVDPYNPTGGRRKRRTMKKRYRRTRKQQKGGYTYDSSKDLDMKSSVISPSIGTKIKSSKSSKSPKSPKLFKSPKTPKSKKHRYYRK